MSVVDVETGVVTAFGMPATPAFFVWLFVCWPWHPATHLNTETRHFCLLADFGTIFFS